MSTTRDWMGERMRAREGVAQASQPHTARSLSPEERGQSGCWSPPVDIYEMDDRIVLRADLPGISIEQIELKIENERMILRGERPETFSSSKGDFRRIERPHGRFVRTFALPQSILQSGIRAVMDNGVLEVVLPKHADQRSKPIKVEVR